MEEILLKGNKLIGGVVLGKTCLYKEDVLKAVPKYKITLNEVEKEIKRLETSLKLTKEDLEQTHKKVLKNLGKTEAEIFQAHILILQDKSFIGKIKDYIKLELINSEHAIIKALEVFESKFKGLPEDYLQERIQDIRDIAKRIVNKLGVKHSGFMCSIDCGSNGSIISTELITPSMIAGLSNKQVGGILSEQGSTTSHGSILAKTLGVPVLINVSGLLSKLSCGSVVLIDGNDSQIYVNPKKETIKRYESQISAPKWDKKQYSGGLVYTSDKTKVKLFVNASSVSEIKRANEYEIKNVGLFRTEFLFLERELEPSVEEQIKEYKKIIDSTKGVVAFRLLDLGGDKIVDFLALPKQDNPNLGLRGVRIFEIYPEIISNQIKALLIAKGKREMKITIPMIATLDEFIKTKEIIIKELDLLKDKYDISRENLKIGCMIEIPSSVYIMDDLLKEADFLSIGTNDLIQYLLGVDRANVHLTHLYDPLQPAVLKVLQQIAKYVSKTDKDIVVCGEVASDPQFVKIIIGLGFRSLSLNIGSMKAVAEKIQESDNADLVNNLANIMKFNSLEKLRTFIN